MGNYNSDKNEIISQDSYYENFHFLLGKIIVNYNLVESQMIMLICNIIDPNNITTGFVIYKGLGSTRLLERLKDLINIKIKDKEILDSFAELHEDLKKIIELRNTFMHSIYLDTSNSEMKLSNKIEKVSRIRLREFEKGKTQLTSDCLTELTPLQALLQWLDDIYERIDKFSHLLSKEIPMKSIKFNVM
jgi:hypothetical protein